MFTKKDLISAVITGVTTGLIAWQVLLFLGTGQIYGFSTVWLIVVVPLAWIIGVEFGYFLGRRISFFNQFGKFVAVGFTNAAVDFGILNLQISLTGIESGWHYPLFKSVSFVVAVIHSYAWNKFWVFDAASTSGGRSEFFKFIMVNLVAILFNVGIASFVVNYIDPMGGLDARVWANIGAVVGSACAIFLTFVGTRLFVFKKQENALP